MGIFTQFISGQEAIYISSSNTRKLQIFINEYFGEGKDAYNSWKYKEIYTHSLENILSMQLSMN